MIYDKDIREPLFDFLDEKYGKNRILEEKRMGRSRADVVMIIENAVYGIEIKSDADTYARLNRQVKDYSLYYDFNIVVVGSKHASHVGEHVPEDWGIVSVEKKEDDSLDFYILREPRKNPKLDIMKKLSILWRPEMAHIQQINGLPAYKGKSKLFVMDFLAGHVEREMLDRQISEELFQRDYTKIAETINAYREANGQKKRRNTKKKRRKYKKIV